MVRGDRVLLNRCLNFKSLQGLWDHLNFNHRGAYIYWLYIYLPCRSLFLPPYTDLTEHPLSIPFQPLVSSAPQIRSGVSQEKSREKRGRGWWWLAGSVLYFSVEASLYGPVFAFKGPTRFSHREEGRPEGGRCFSFSELPGHVCALTCPASWVIKPSRWIVTDCLSGFLPKLLEIRW